MSNLRRWLPFKFRRKSKETPRKADATVAPTAGRAFPTLLSSPFQDVVRTMFSDPFFRTPLTAFERDDTWFGDFSPARFDPSVDVIDEEDALRVTAELPGMDKDSVDLRIDNGMLVIQGEKRYEDESREEGVYRAERFYGHFQRAVPLPVDVDVEAAEATFKNGILAVRFPKKADASGGEHRIEVRS